MVKFTDRMFQDAYLCSLRQNDFEFDSPPPAAAAAAANSRKQLNTTNDTNSSITTTTATDTDTGTGTGTVVSSGKKTSSSSSSATGQATEAEEYTSPILQRSRERQLERQSFLNEYEGNYAGLSSLAAFKRRETSNGNGAEKTPGTSGSSAGKKEEEDVDVVAIPIRTTLRTKKLWDFDNQQEHEDQQRDDDGDDDYDYDYDDQPTSHHHDLDYTPSNDNEQQKRDTTSTTLTPPNDADNDSSDQAVVVWSSAQIRREMRRDITKRAKSDLSEMEEFTANMRRRIRNYNGNNNGSIKREDDGSRIVLVEKKKKDDDDESKFCDVYYNGKDDVKEMDDSEGRGGGDICNADIGIELRLTRSQSSVDIPMISKATTPKKQYQYDDNEDDDDGIIDDGYGKRVTRSPRMSAKKKAQRELYDLADVDVDSFIHKFQNTTIKKYNPSTREDEQRLMMKNDIKREQLQQQQPRTLSRQEQARKIASYRGINREEDGDDGEDNSMSQLLLSDEYYAAGSNKARLQRIRDLSRKQQHLQSEERSPHVPKSSLTDIACQISQREKDESPIDTEQMKYDSKPAKKMDLDSWWQKHKREQQGQLVGYDNDCDDDDEEEEAEVSNLKSSEKIGSSKRLESWWKIQQIKKQKNETNLNDVNGGGRMVSAPSTPFDEELIEEPTMFGTGVARSTPCHVQTVRPTFGNNIVPLLPPLNHPTPAYTTQFGKECDTPTLLNFNKTRASKECDTPTLLNFRSRHSTSDSSVKSSGNSRRKGPPCPETPRGYGDASERKERMTQGASKNDLSVPQNQGQPPSSIVGVLDYTQSSTAASALSDDDDEDEGTNECSRCQSVAQSTLLILLSRIEEAKMNFTKALEEGNVEQQAELAGLMTRLGEAAVTMRKLEQT